jgi:DNA-binding response OmpR family regulator
MAAATDRKPLVLVVDDDPDIRALFQSVLGREFRVEVAEDGWAALQRINKKTYDAIVLDMAMPHKSGLSVLTEVRSDELTKNIPVVVVSAVAPDNDLWAGVEHQWDSYLQKPVSVAELVATVGKLIRRRNGGRKKAAARKGVAKKAAPRKGAAKKVAARKVAARKPAARAPKKKVAPKKTAPKSAKRAR